MNTLSPSATREILGVLHEELAAHFRHLAAQRRDLDGDAPIFALEHGLAPGDLGELKAAVRSTVAPGFGRRSWQLNWLPFTVYAAEAGYAYSGDEFWPSFDHLTPGWSEYGDREHVRTWFTRFHRDYGGAEPKGAFARNFPIIAWPITHAMLPVYLQRHLARLLYEFRMGLTTDLLARPEELGTRLASRTRDYTERFRIFCENTTLLGHLAVALLSGEEEPSPFVLPQTLHRIVEGLEMESEAKRWLQGARKQASRVRARGLQPGTRAAQPASERLPAPTDPRLLLRAGEAGWRLHAQLPDLRPLAERLPHVYAELRENRAHIDGAAAVLARGRLVMPGQEIALPRWPDPNRPFVRIEDGDEATNRLIRDQVAITRGPIWLFKRRGRTLAGEVRSRLVRPGGVYYLVHRPGTWTHPEAPWIERVDLDVAGVQAVRLKLPDHLSEADTDTLTRAGLSVASAVHIRPVGVTARHWNGEGSVEWLAGEGGLLGIHAEQIPTRVTLEVAGMLRTQEWPAGQHELFLKVEALPVGEHHLQVTLAGSDRELAAASVRITVLDPPAPAAGAEPGEGIRLLTSPARPSLSELWEPDAVSIAGPAGLSVDLHAILLGEDLGEIARIHAPVTLPLDADGWAAVASRLRGSEQFQRHFDDAESVQITVSRAGVGYASATADRGFQPLRWRLVRGRDGTRARLVDHTDTGATRTWLYRFEAPLSATMCEPGADITAPVTGGLVRAVAGGGIQTEATVLLPTQPNELLHAGTRLPEVATRACTPLEIARLAGGYRLWERADLPGDVFARRQRDTVLEAVTRTAVSLIAGTRWASLERRVAAAADPLDLIEDLQDAVGGSIDQRQLAQTISRRLYEWSDAAALLIGFNDIIAPALRSAGLAGHGSAARLLLTLAGRCGDILTWTAEERDFIVRQVIATPALLRAARFAVLGTRLLADQDDERQGF